MPKEMASGRCQKKWPQEGDFRTVQQEMATGRQPREDSHVNDHLLKKQFKKTVQKDCGEASQHQKISRNYSYKYDILNPVCKSSLLKFLEGGLSHAYYK